MLLLPEPERGVRANPLPEMRQARAGADRQKGPLHSVDDGSGRRLGPGTKSKGKFMLRGVTVKVLAGHTAARSLSNQKRVPILFTIMFSQPRTFRSSRSNDRRSDEVFHR
jgi:hypothetical protein